MLSNVFEPREVQVSTYKDDDTGWPCLLVVIDGIGRYGFTLHGMDEKQQKWLVSVIERQFREIHEKSFKLGVHAVRTEMKSVLGVK